jgi:hypothetical protein
MPDLHLGLDSIYRDENIRGSWTGECSEECCCSEIHTSKFPIRCELTGVWYHLFDSEDHDK